jgi:triacylglycerol esterase/lipase EstA (alpha/beta hydrolase family)
MNRRSIAALATAAAATTAASLALSAAPAIASTSSGYNDWSCHPTATHPDPVVLIHGLGSNGQENWSVDGPALATAGYCAYSLTYGENSPGDGVGGQQPVATSAQQIVSFIGQVRASTGALKVDLVGHSEGAFMTLYIPKFGGIAEQIDRVVALAPPTHGTTVDGIVTLGQLLGGQQLVDFFPILLGCQACADLIAGSGVVKQLDTEPIAQPGITYTIIATRDDEVVTPTTTAFVTEPGVHDYYVQDKCPFDPVGHVGLAVDPGVTSMILNGLDPGAPIVCGFGPPF